MKKIPESYNPTREPKNKREAISFYCRRNCTDPLDKGSALDQINRCTVTNCPLYKFRPQKKSPNSSVQLNSDDFQPITEEIE